ncbi:ARM repeat-containing protein [Cristinia sonorae]|uniref:MMS19 nucleotide excision repair protein n=1 Tax=Cristinia sonorae TaxID=1940300 RepID=A0A8K0XK47_9AGAR|nr:ARM repeat-containing protein [Cristinia sonorae]
MDRMERLVRTWMATGKVEEVENTVSEVLNGDGALLPLIKALGEYLTSEEDDQRRKGVEFLSLVLEKYPQEKLNRQSVKTLVTFFRGKLDDTETIIPALQGLVSLSAASNLTSQDAVEISQSLFQYVKMKALVQSHRFKVFTILDTLIARQREALKGMGKTFVAGYINLAEGEKDPRNLMLAFAIARVLLIEFDVSSHVEDLFNITFCYFPITFRPPPDDPYGITSEDLKKTLRSALTASPAFGPFAIPLFIEKLTAGSPTTKRDTLQTLDEALPIYGASLARTHARKLWNSLKLEIFQPTDSETESEALKTTQVLIQTIYGSSSQTALGPEPGSEAIEGLAKDACEECIRILKEPEKSQAKPATKVICAFMSTTPSVSKYTLSQAVPHFIRLFLNPDEASNRGPTLRLLADVIVAARDSSLLDPEVLPTQGEVALSPFKDEVLGVFTVGLKTPTTRKHALDGLKGLVTTRGLLSDEELGFIVHNVNEVLTEDGNEDEDVREAILDLFGFISSTTARHISQTTLPLLFSSLPDQAPDRSAEAERLKYWRTLAFLKRLCLQADLFEMLVVRLSTKLDLICSPDSPPSGADATSLEPTAAYAHSILRTLADAIAVKVEKGDVDVPKYIDRLLPRLFHLHLYGALSGTEGYNVAADPRLVTVTSQIVTLIVQVQPPSRQETFVASLFAAYFSEDVKRISDGQPKLPEDTKFTPFTSDAPLAQKTLVVLFSAAIIALHKEIALPVPDESGLLDSILHWSIDNAASQAQRESLLNAVASVVNKRPDGLGSFLSEKLPALWTSQGMDPLLPAEKRRKVIAAWSHITRALLVRGHALFASFTDKLFELFEDTEISWDAARALGSIVATDKILTKRNHAVVKMLHAQKFFNLVLPRIVEGAKLSGNAPRQNAYLVALTTLIKSMPRSAYTHELPTLMPLLLRGLDLPDADIRANVIDTFLAASDASSPESKENAVISEHATSLVSTMLKNAMVNEMPSARLRIAALRYLALLPSLVRYDVLHAQKAVVIRDLAKVLDDPKKAVRKEAVEARTNWFKFTG